MRELVELDKDLIIAIINLLNMFKHIQTLKA